MNGLSESRKDILFLYDAALVNPNGDPLEDNRPRMIDDREIVTDVRLKRTIRDFIDRNASDEFLKKRGAKVWVLEERKNDGSLKTKEEKLKEKEASEYWNYTDIRLFGATLLGKNEDKNNENKKDEENVIVFTGPVQFRIGFSLNKVNPIYIRGTTVLPSGSGKEQGTFTERWIVEYALISFYGTYNPNISEENEKIRPGLKVQDEDLEVLFYSMWNGTKDLVSQSKVGQTPRLLMVVDYNKNSFQIGPLDDYISLVSDECKSINDVKLNIGRLIEVLKENESKIKSVWLAVDDQLQLYIKENEKISKQDLINLIPSAKFFDNEFKF